MVVIAVPENPKPGPSLTEDLLQALLRMLLDIGCTHVINGHSELRQYFGETDDVVNFKLNGRWIDANCLCERSPRGARSQLNRGCAAPSVPARGPCHFGEEGWEVDRRIRTRLGHRNW